MYLLADWVILNAGGSVRAPRAPRAENGVPCIGETRVTVDVLHPASTGDFDRAEPLARIVGRIEAAFVAREYSLVGELIERNLLAAWFGIEPHRFAEIVAALLERGDAVGPTLRALSAIMLTDPNAPRPAAPDAGAGAPEAESPEAVAVVENLTAAGLMFSLRLEGRMTEAFAGAETLLTRKTPMRPVYDWNRGWALFSSVQYGLTAMLAGRFAEALVSFTNARMHGRVPALHFLTRDACVRAAVIEALYGDVVKARALLEEAESIPRTSSWVEPELDALYALADALVRAPAAEALARIDAVTLSSLGESWPFYFAALQYALQRASNLPEAVRRAAVFAQLPLPVVAGDGYAGSIQAICSAVTSAAQGDLGEARAQIESADRSLHLTRLVLALIEMASGRFDEALRIGLNLREATAGLRRLEVWRRATVAECYWTLGEEEACAAIIALVLAEPDAIRADEIPYFSRGLRDFARQRFPAWPSVDDTVAPQFVFIGEGQENLTDRELESLRLLAQGLSREQIAKAQFISINTVKGNLGSLYRKLGVGSRAAAVTAGEQRGLL